MIIPEFDLTGLYVLIGSIATAYFGLKIIDWIEKRKGILK